MVEAGFLKRYATMTTAPRLTIDLSALARNWQALCKCAPQSQTAAVVKANAYGLGIEDVVPALSRAGCNTFFVAMIEEGIRVRRIASNARVFVLNGIFADTVGAALEHRLSPVLSTMAQVELWASGGGGEGCALHVDTGMNRLGLSRQQAEELADNSGLVEACKAGVIMSHFACADDPEHPLNAEQLAKFEAIAERFPGLERSLANSAALLSNPTSCFDLARPGIALYGAEAVNDTANPMEPVVTAEARILQIRQARKGESVGYGAAQVLERDVMIAICSAGYADGYHRASSGSGVPLRKADGTGGFGAIGNLRVPVLGRVSMDLTAFDVTDVPQTTLESTEWIELFGASISVDEAARACGTIGYELLTGLGQRYQRRFIDRDG